MNDPDDFDEAGPLGEASAIGVGMGGSCPVCRAPVDLGQEFCLECGSPIRFTPRQRRGERRGMGRAGAGAPPPASAPRGAPPKGGFPWIPFLVVLALIGGGVAFALVDGNGGGDRRSGGDETEPALPTITNSVPETTSETETTTVPSCDDAASLEDTVPAVDDAGIEEPPLDDGSVDDGTQDAGTSEEQIPELSDGGIPEDPSFGGEDVPSTDADGAETVTVDQDGNLCSGGSTDDASSDPFADPSLDPGTDTPGTDPGTGTTPGTPDDGSPTPGSNDTGDWPAGEEGWTVIVAGYNSGNPQQRAVQAAADLQEKGFTDGGVLESSSFQSLCPGFHVVFSGTFDSEAQAERRYRELAAKGYAGMYVREISTTAPAPANCTTTR